MPTSRKLLTKYRTNSCSWKLSQNGLFIWLLKVLFDCLIKRKQSVWTRFLYSLECEITSRVLEGSFLRLLLACIFRNDLAEVIRFSCLSNSADDLQAFSVNKWNTDLQCDLEEMENWVKQNDMKIALEKSTQFELRSQSAISNNVDHNLKYNRSTL